MKIAGETKAIVWHIFRTLVVSTPFDIKLSAKGAAIDEMTIEPKGGRIDTHAASVKFRFSSSLKNVGSQDKQV